LVVAGFSDTSAAALQTLLCSLDFSFSSVTIINAGGIGGQSVAPGISAAGGAGGGGFAPGSAKDRYLSHLGLASSCEIVDDVLIGIDRESRILSLASGHQVTYGVLLLAPGIQDQTIVRLSDEINAFVEEYHTRPPIIAVHELDSALTPDVVADLTDSATRGRPTVVFGESEAAVEAVHKLLAAGLPASAIRLELPGRIPQATCAVPLEEATVESETGRGVAAIMVKAVQAAEAQGGVNPLQGLLMHGPPDPAWTSMITGVDDVGEDFVSVTITESDAVSGEQRETTMGGRLFVTCDAPSVDLDMFRSLDDAGIVFDGRIVVDAAFRTNDSAIFAAGPAARFSQRYGTQLYQEHYNSLELGRLLGKSVVRHFEAEIRAPFAALAGTQPQNSNTVNNDLRNQSSSLSTGSSSVVVNHAAPATLPVLLCPRVTTCVFGGAGEGDDAGSVFLYAGCPDAMKAPRLGAPPGGKILEKYGSGTGGALLRLNLDAELKIHSVVCMGPKTEETMRLVRLAGLHSSYLGNIVNEMGSGLIQDLAETLNQPWMSALYEDSFTDLRRQLVTGAVQSSVAMPAMSRPGSPTAGAESEKALDEATVKLGAIEATVSFVRANLLSMYAV